MNHTNIVEAEQEAGGMVNGLFASMYEVRQGLNSNISKRPCKQGNYKFAYVCINSTIHYGNMLNIIVLIQYPIYYKFAYVSINSTVHYGNMLNNIVCIPQGSLAHL